jgi:hypothetical protein
MPLVLLVVLAPAHLENLDLVVPAVGNHGALHRRPGNQGGADLHVLAFAYHEDLIERDFCANFCRYLFYFEFLAGANAILLAAGFYDRVHVGLQRLRKRTRDYTESFWKVNGLLRLAAAAERLPRRPV